MATSPPAAPPSTLPRSLVLVWGELFRRPGTFLAITVVPTLLGWLAVAAVRAALLSSGRWENGTITSGSWLDLPPGQWLMAVLAHSGLPIAYALAAVLVVPHRIGPRTRPVALRVALAVVGRRWPLLVGWWALIGFFVVLAIGGVFLFWTGRAAEAGPYDMLMMAAGIVGLPVMLALALPLLPVALLEDIPAWNRDATHRVRELSPGRRLAEFGAFLLAVGLLLLPGVAAAGVADLPADTVDGIALGMVTQGLLLGSVAPFAVLAVLAPLLLPGGDTLRIPWDLRNAKAGEGRHVVLGVLAVIALVAFPLTGAHLTRTALTGVPQVSTTSTREAPRAMEPLSDGSGYATLSIGSSADPDADPDSDPLVLSTCGPDCDEDRVREREIGVFPEDSLFVAGAVAPVGADLFAVVARVPDDLGSTPDPEGHPLVLDVHRCSESACDGPWTAEPGDPLNVRAHAPFPGSETLDLYGYDLELAADESGALAVLVQPAGRPLEIVDPDYDGFLVTCAAQDCAGASVRELPEVSNARLALGRDGSPVIAHLDADTAAVGLLVCGDPTCADHETRRITTSSSGPSTSSDSPPVPSVAVGPTGAPQVVTADGRAARLLYHACAEASCTSWETRTLLAPRLGLGSYGNPHLVLDGDGRPSILLDDLVVRCDTPYCGTGA